MPTISSHPDKPDIPQHSQMLRDRRLLHLQTHRDVTNSPLLKRQIFKISRRRGSATALKESKVLFALAIKPGCALALFR